MHPMNFFSDNVEEIIRNFENLKKDKPQDFDGVVDLICNLDSNIITTGIGKSAFIAQKLSASLASIGRKSFFVHPVEAMHGDSGRLGKDDLCLIISHSGAGGEISGLVKFCLKNKVKIASLTSNRDSFIGNSSDFSINYKMSRELCRNNLAPTMSSILCMAIADLICASVIEKRKISENDFRTFHPAGDLGRLLRPVIDVMHPIAELDSLDNDSALQEVYKHLNNNKYGMIAVLENGQFLGIITDGDLRRNFSKFSELEVRDLISVEPITVNSEMTILEASKHMKKNSVNQLLISEKSNVIGFVHARDLSG